MSHVFDLEPGFLELYERCRASTMTSIERMYALYTATRHVANARVPGDFVECGVWRGGSVMLMALTLLGAGAADRTLWLYDTFSGMTPPSDDDVQAMSGRSAAEILAVHEKTPGDPFWGVAARPDVEENIRSTGYPSDRVRIVGRRPSDDSCSRSLADRAAADRYGLVCVDKARARAPVPSPLQRRRAHHR